MYRITRWAPAALVAALVALGTVAVVSGLVLLASLMAGAVLVAWLAVTMRLVRLQPAGRPGVGDDPAPPGGAPVREPRRPLPMAPAGAAAVPLPDD